MLQVHWALSQALRREARAHGPAGLGTQPRTRGEVMGHTTGQRPKAQRARSPGTVQVI